MQFALGKEIVLQVYIVLLGPDCSEDSLVKMRNNLKENFEQTKRFDNHTFFVRIPHAENMSVRDISESIGIRGENTIPGAQGVVFRLAKYYSGRGPTDISEWLSDGFGDD